MSRDDIVSGQVLTIYGQSEGTGKLTATGNKNDSNAAGIFINDTLNIHGGIVEAAGGDGASGRGIFVTGDINNYGGVVTAVGGQYGIFAPGTILISGNAVVNARDMGKGSGDSSRAIYCGELTISGGNIIAQSEVQAFEKDPSITGYAGIWYGEDENSTVAGTEQNVNGIYINKYAKGHIHYGGKATCTEKARCTVCGEFYGDPLGHDWSGDWEKHDNISHVKKCKNDENHVQFEEHESTFICGENPVRCKCGVIAEKEHKYDRDTWVHNDSYHWHGCLNCMAKIDNKEHNYPNKAMIGKVPQTCTVCDEGGHIIDTVHSALDESHITEDLKNAGCSDVASIKEKMHLQAKDTASWEGALEDTKLYEVQLMYSKDGGISWFPASPEHFPMIDNKPGKLSVNLPVPAGTIDTHDYTVFHMFSKNAFGKKAGDIETIETENIREFEEDGQQYISFYVTGLSPIMVAWEETSELYSGGEGTTDETPGEAKDQKKYPIDEDGDGEIDFYLSEDEFDADDYVAVDEDEDGNTDYYVPKDVYDEDDGVDSGDDSNILPLLLVMMTALTAAAITIIGRRCRRN